MSKKNNGPKKTCSFHSKTNDGKEIYGTAAFLHLSSQNGGIDNVLKEIATTAYEAGVKEGAKQATDIVSSLFSKKDSDKKWIVTKNS